MGGDWARPVVHFQITARDPARQASFYRLLFGWDAGAEGLLPFPAGLGGPEPGPAGHFRPGAEPGVTLYVQVRDIHKTARLASENGGTVTRQPALAGSVTIAFIEDPEGNAVGLVQQ